MGVRKVAIILRIYERNLWREKNDKLARSTLWIPAFAGITCGDFIAVMK
jgi:hypothetical protein